MNAIKENIIKELGLEELSEEGQMEMVTKMTESVLKRIAINALEKLSDEEREEFEKLQENASPEEIDAFLRSKIGDYEQMIKETVVEFKNEIKESISRLKKSLE
ncbi:MAG: hypothetical protein GXP44_01655 [bacterium]|nr:hypothetical protein [bacterium]